MQRWKEGDRPFLDRILSDNFVGWDYEGNRYTKADSEHDLSSGEWTTTSLRVEDINVRLYGNTAVVTSRAIRAGEYNGRDSAGQFRWTKVYVKTGGQWQVVASAINSDHRSMTLQVNCFHMP